MKRLILAAILLTIALTGLGCATSNSTPPAKTVANIEGDHPILKTSSWNGYCGVERATVKHTTDSYASKINTAPKPTTIEQMRGLPVPSGISGRSAPRQPQEMQVYTLTATISKILYESDGDAHLVLTSASGNTMIGEVIPPSCASGSPFLSQLTTARSTIAKISAPKKVTLTGVGYFDFIHGQTGVAPNGIELHPILSIK